MRLGSSEPSPTCVRSIASPIACEATSLEPPVKIAPPAASQDAPSSSRSAHRRRPEPRGPESRELREPGQQGPQHQDPHPQTQPEHWQPPAAPQAPARRHINSTHGAGNPHRATASSSSSRPPSEKIEQPEQIELAEYPRPADATAQKYLEAVRQREHTYDLRRAEKRRWLEEQDEMKFSHSLQFNAVPDWSSHYIAYSNLKKLCVPPRRGVDIQNTPHVPTNTPPPPEYTSSKRPSTSRPAMPSPARSSPTMTPRLSSAAPSMSSSKR